MAQKILVSLDLAGNQVLGFRLENLAADPTPLGAGHLYENTTSGNVRYYNGTAWGDLSGGGSSSGDMLISVFDPTGVGADVFDIDNHVEGTTNKLYTAIEKLKLAGIASNATVNSADATLLARGNHTGSQSTSTISDFTTAVDALIDARTTGAPAAYDTFIKIADEMAADDSAYTALVALVGAKTDKYAEDIGDGSATSIAVTHNLGSLDVLMSVRDASTHDVVLCDMQATTTNTATFTFSIAPTTDQYRVVVVG